VYGQFCPHILHFIGHGRSPDKKESALEMWNCEKEPHTQWFWQVKDMAGDLTGRAPRLAFINACHSQHAPDREGLWSIGDTLIQIGTRAVLGMQGAIAGVAAARCAGGVYQALLDRNPLNRKPLDVALADARGAVAALVHKGAAPRNWSLPALRLAVPPDQVLPIDWSKIQPLLLDLERVAEFKRNPWFVNRAPKRQDLLNKVALGAARRSDLILVRGSEKVGKTQLLRWCLAACLLRGYNLKYIDLGGEKTLDFRGVLRLIKEGKPTRVLGRPLPQEAFRSFDQNWGSFWTGDPHGSEEWIGQLFAAFREALAAAARAALTGPASRPPLLLVLDHLSGNPRGGVDRREFTKYLLPHLLEPTAQERGKEVILILAVTTEEYEQLELSALEAVPESVALELFPWKQYTPLAYEYCRRKQFRRERWQRVVDELAKNVAEDRSDWSPSELTDLDNIRRIQ